MQETVLARDIQNEPLPQPCISSRCAAAPPWPAAPSGRRAPPAGQRSRPPRTEWPPGAGSAACGRASATRPTCSPGWWHSRHDVDGMHGGMGCHARQQRALERGSCQRARQGGAAAPGPATRWRLQHSRPAGAPWPRLRCRGPWRWRRQPRRVQEAPPRLGRPLVTPRRWSSLEASKGSCRAPAAAPASSRPPNLPTSPAVVFSPVARAPTSQLSCP